MLKTGDLLPNISLESDEGKQINLHDITDKKLVIFFYSKDNSAGCTKEALSINGVLNEIKALNAEVIGISPDKVATHKKFKESKQLDFTLLSDPEHIAGLEFGTWGEKVVCGKTCMGTYRTTFIANENHEIIKVFEKVKAADHGNEILKELHNFR